MSKFLQVDGEVEGGPAQMFDSTEQAMVFGLAEETCAAATALIADNPDTNIVTVLADKDFIGWGSFTNAAPTFRAAFQKAGQSAVATETGAFTQNDTYTYALATWYKLGLKFDPAEDTIDYFVDGVRYARVDVSAAGTTTFPSGENLTVYLAIKAGTTAAKILDVDWIRVAQEI